MPVRPKNDPLAERLRRVRHQLGWNQKRMAKELAINRSTLSTWESFGPPARGPARKFVVLKLKLFSDRIRDADAKEQAKSVPDAGI